MKRGGTPLPENPIAKRIEEARVRVGLSQKRLGLEMGFDPSVASARINHYERGRHAPGFRVVAQISATTDVPEAYFFAVSDDLAEFIAIFAALSVRKQKQALKLVRQLKDA